MAKLADFDPPHVLDVLIQDFRRFTAMRHCGDGEPGLFGRVRKQHREPAVARDQP
jgi:hypothetical protein